LLSTMHYAALPPVRSDPNWSHSHAIIASTTTRTARDSNLGSGNHDLSRLSTLAYLNGASIHGLTDIPLRLLPTDIGCGTLDPRSSRNIATHATRDSDLGSGNHDMSRLSALAYLNDAPIHGLSDIPLRRLPTDIGCGTLVPRTRRDTATVATHCSRLKPRQWQPRHV
jgi:hypothetical protein